MTATVSNDPSASMAPASSDSALRLMTVLGTRPEYVKASALQHALSLHNSTEARPIDHLLVDTGQHYDHHMSALFLDELDLGGPMHNLEIGSGTHGMQTGRMLQELEPMLDEFQPDMIVVYGDTNSTISGALTAAKAVLPLAHVESGLRSYDRSMPEEVNRVVTDHLADLLLCPSEIAVQNLAAEGLVDGVRLTGDLNFDVLRLQLGSGRWTEQLVAQRGLRPGTFALATVHRVENTDDPTRLEAILEALADLSDLGRDVIFPVHPRTRQVIEDWIVPERVRVTDPVGFHEMIALQRHAAVIITDSGGVQKEAFWLETPCLTLRDRTEWHETVTAGWNTLVDASRADIVRHASTPRRPAGRPPLVYGDAHAADRIVRDIVAYLISEVRV